MLLPVDPRMEEAGRSLLDVTARWWRMSPTVPFWAVFPLLNAAGALSVRTLGFPEALSPSSVIWPYI